MANHAKRRPVPKGIWIGSAVTAAVAILVTVGILLVNNGVLDAFMGLFSHSPSSLVDSSTLPPVESDASAQPEPEPIVFHRPDKLSGVRLTPGVDYLTSGKETADAVKAQLDAAMTAAKDWGFNTLLLPVTYKDKALFETEALETYRLTGTDSAAFDPVAYLLSLSGNIDAVWFAFPIAEVASLAMTVILFLRLYRKKIRPLSRMPAAE